jgi:TolA-binding protein
MKILIVLTIVAWVGVSAAAGGTDRIADDMRYDNAFQFYRLEQYAKAQILFEEYLEVFTDGVHRESAYAALGRIHFTAYRYPKALKVFLGHYEEFSTTEDGVQAYFNAGVCYQKMGMKKEALAVFNRIVEDYPTYQAAQAARMQLDVMDVLK